MDPMKPMDLGTLAVMLEDGRTMKLKLLANVRWGEPVLEVRDAETDGKVNWCAFTQLGSLPASVRLEAAETPEPPKQEG